MTVTNVGCTYEVIRLPTKINCSYERKIEGFLIQRH